MSTNANFIRILIAANLLPLFTISTAYSDINGVPVSTPQDCGANAFSALEKICSLLGAFGSTVECTPGPQSCSTDSQEMFTGDMIEIATPTNIKNWTGFGGGGVAYGFANLCLLRDLKDAPIDSTATASTILGDVSIKQHIQFQEYNHETLTWTGYQQGRICVPAFGCMDLYTQKLQAIGLYTDLGSAGLKAGEYKIFSSHALDMQADGMTQSLGATIPAIQVDTPYGAISVKPEFHLGRHLGLSLAPYAGGNINSLLTGGFGAAKMQSLYGRNAGTARTQTYPGYTIGSAGTFDNRIIGYDSQVGFGARSADPKAAVWAPPVSVLYPPRPDGNLDVARSSAEKSPNAYVGASVNVKYSPTDLLPEAIRDNPLVSIAFDVFAQPEIGGAFTTQFDGVNAEISKALKIGPGGTLDYRPMFMEQYKYLTYFAGSSAMARFALEAGVDLVLHLHVWLPWPLDDIDLDLVNLHPRTTVLESITTGKGTGSRNAMAASQASKVAATGEWFQGFKSFKGPIASGKAFVEACLAKPTETVPPPAEPTFTPGNPSDLTKPILYPCNICVGMGDYTYTDAFGTSHTIKGFLQNLYPADESVKPVGIRWTCDQVYESGCFDMCSYDTTTKQLTVVDTALEMIAAGNTHHMPLRCH